MSADGLITVEELGKQVKSKYPVYGSKSDTEVGQAVLKKYPVYASRVQPAAPGIKPEARTVGNYLKEGAYGVGRGLKGDVKGALQMATHPQEAASQFTTQAMAAPMMAKQTFDTAPGTVPQRFAAAALRGLEEAPVLGPMVQYAEKGGDRMGSPEEFGAAMEATTSLEAPGAAGKGVGALLSKAPDVARAMAGAGEGPVKDLVKKTGAENAASAAQANEAKAVETKRGGLQKDIHEKSRELQGRIETARNNALKEGNQKYQAVNEKLGAEPANEAAIQSAVAEAKGKLKGTGAEPDILKKVAARVESGDFVYQGGAKFGPGTPLYEQVKASPEGLPRQPGSKSKPFTYDDLQGTYSELGTELSKGTLPGDTYTALDTLHEAIGNEMQRIADSKGLGAQLTDARNYWRKMKQTFGRPAPVRDAATKTLNSLSPEFAKQEKTGNAVRMLGDYDPEISRTAGEVTEARKGLKSLPKAKPTDAVKKTIGSGDVRGAKGESVEKRADMIEHRGTWVATWPLFHVMSSIMRGEIPNVAGTAMESLGTYGAVRGVANILRNPKVVEFLTRATPKDIEQIPPDLRGNFPGIVQAAQKGGIKVAPALIRAFQAGTVVGQAKKRVGDLLPK